jgi:hypothetical protein
MSPFNNFAKFSANLYFSSWGGFIMSFIVLVKYIEEKYGTSNHLKMITGTQISWVSLCMTSFIVMVSASRFYIAECFSFSRESSMCRRTAYGISLGVISIIISVLWAASSLCRSTQSAIELVESISSIILCIMWTFGVAYITFGSSAPAASVGNLYFFTWGSFVISALLAMNGIHALTKKGSTNDDQPQPSNNQNNQEPVEP